MSKCEVLMDATNAYLLSHSILKSSDLGGNRDRPPSGFWFLVFIIGALCLFQVCDAYGGRIPGEDVSDKMEAAGSLLKLTDTLLFNWVTKLLSGICILTGALALKDQRFPIFIMCIIAALLLGTKKIRSLILSVSSLISRTTSFKKLSITIRLSKRRDA